MPPKNTAKKKKQEQLAEEVKRIRKDPSNLTCADCPVRSTPYICIDYSSFICTGCAGIHRTFNHRVKSIAVATFNEKEVDKIREGGNALLNRKYLAKYKKNKDSFTLPREGETEKIKQYIQLKYVDKKWFKENPKPIKEKKKKKKKKKKHKKKKVFSLLPLQSPSESVSLRLHNSHHRHSIPMLYDRTLSLRFCVDIYTLKTGGNHCPFHGNPRDAILCLIITKLTICVPVIAIQSVSISEDLEVEEEDDQVADVKSPSQSNHSASNHTTPQQQAQSGGYDDLISFDAFSPPQNAQQQPQSAQSGNDDWGNFGDQNGNATANGGGGGGDNAGWDPFASSPEQPSAQPVQQQQPPQQQQQNQGQSMGWDS